MENVLYLKPLWKAYLRWGPPGWSRDERSPGARILNFLQLEKERNALEKKEMGLIDRGANHKC